VPSAETLRAIRRHAGLQDDGVAAVADALTHGAGVEAAVTDFLGVLQRLNVEMNGSVPSARVEADLAMLPRGLVYAVAEVARMLRDAGRGDDAWAVDTGWLAVLAGDIDDIAEHIALERTARN